MLSHTCMGVPYEYTHMGRPIRVWANIPIWGRTITIDDYNVSGTVNYVSSICVAHVPATSLDLLTWINRRRFTCLGIVWRLSGAQTVAK